MATTEKKLNTRIQLKYDTYANWTSDAGKNVVLKKGEVGICAIPTDTTAISGDVTRPQILMKVGDGDSTFENLKWVSALAADVHAWAKKSESEFTTWVKTLVTLKDIDAYSKSEVDGLLSSNSTADQKYAKDYADGLAANYDKAGKAQELINALDVTDSAVTGQYVSAVSETDGKISVTRADLPTYTLASGTANGTVAFNGTDVAVTGLKSAAYTDSKDYATAAQGAKADTALQASDVVTGSANGTIAVKGTDVAVKGLGSAAYTDASAYATSAQGTKADSAMQSVSIMGKELANGGSVSVDEAKTALGLKSAAYTEASAYATADQGALADSAVQKVTVLGHELSNGGSVSADEAKLALGLGSAAYEDKDAFDAAGTGFAEAAKVLGDTTDAAGDATVHGALKAAAAAQADIDAFFAGAETGEAALDTLKEIQAFLDSDEGTVQTLLDNVAANAAAIEDVVDGTTTVAKAAHAATADTAVQASGLNEAGVAAVKAVKVENAANADAAGDAAKLGGTAAADYLKKSDAPGYGDILTKTSAASTYETVAKVNEVRGRVTALEGKPGLDKVGTVTSVTAGDGLAGGAITESGTISLSDATKTSLAKADTAVQPAALNNYYTKSDADAEFMNSAETDGAIDAKITALNLANTYEPKGAEAKARAYADGLAKNYATAAQGAKADSALQEITTTANGGLKVTNKSQIDIDDSIVFVFDCGSSTVNVE